jgi:hypothetical protein
VGERNRAIGAKDEPIDFPKIVQVARTMGLHWRLLDPRLSTGPLAQNRT